MVMHLEVHGRSCNTLFPFSSHDLKIKVHITGIMALPSYLIQNSALRVCDLEGGSEAPPQPSHLINGDEGQRRALRQKPGFLGTPVWGLHHGGCERSEPLG